MFKREKEEPTGEQRKQGVDWFMTCTPQQTLWKDHINKDEIVDIWHVQDEMVAKFEGWFPLGRGGRRWENIKLDFEEKIVGEVDWIIPAQERDKLQDTINTVMKLGFHKALGVS